MFSHDCLCPPCSTLSQCCHAVVALLYPFVWQHTYIPVLPSAMLDIVCTPTPFIVGLLSSSLPQLTELPLEEVRRAIIFVCLFTLGNRFVTSIHELKDVLHYKNMGFVCTGSGCGPLQQSISQTGRPCVQLRFFKFWGLCMIYVEMQDMTSTSGSLDLSLAVGWWGLHLAL